MTQSRKTNLAQYIGFSSGSMPFMYLGIPDENLLGDDELK